jgi:membrane-associated protease RseP (regulator of RpoE activity)
MVDRMAQAAAIQAGRLAAYASVSVVYARPNVGSVTVNATPGNTPFETQEADGVVTVIVRRDYMIATADLLIGGQTITPQPGDTITETLPGGGTATYEVTLTGNEPCWRWADRPYRNRRRIHTNEIALAGART